MRLQLLLVGACTMLGCTAQTRTCDDTCPSEGAQACRSASSKVTCVMTAGGCLAWDDGVRCSDCSRDLCSAGPGQDAGTSPKDAGIVTKADAGSAVGQLQQEVQSGSRLKPVLLVGEDGSKQWHQSVWRDTLRNEDCIFKRVAGGGFRCIPGFSYSEPTFFADSSCTIGLLYRAEGAGACQPGGVAAITSSSVCASDVVRVQSIGPSHAGDIYIRESGLCTKGTRFAGLEFNLFGAEIPLTSFVAAQKTVE